MSRLTPRLAALLLVSALSEPAWAGTQLAGRPKVVFEAVGSPGLLSIEGVTQTVSLADDGATLTFTVPMTTVETGISLRDQHMRDHYVEVAKYPDVTLSLRRDEVTWPTSAGESTSGVVTATFTAHGTPVQVEVTYEVKALKEGRRVVAEFPFDVRQHGIAIPSYLGVTIAPEMKARVTAELVDAP